MKRVLMAIFFAFLSITFVAGGVCLLQGCSQSTPKDGGGGISDSPENPDDEDNTKVDGYNITVTFNANGGAIIASSNWSGYGSSVQKSYYYDSNISESSIGDVVANAKPIKPEPAPLPIYGTIPVSGEISRKGYLFAGWYLSETGGTRIESSTNVRAVSSYTVYAHWNSTSTSTSTIDDYADPFYTYQKTGNISILFCGNGGIFVDGDGDLLYTPRSDQNVDDTTTSILHFAGDKKFFKTTSTNYGHAYSACFYNRETGYTMPVLVSTDANEVTYKYGTSGSAIYSSSSFTFEGRRYYYSGLSTSYSGEPVFYGGATYNFKQVISRNISNQYSALSDAASTLLQSYCISASSTALIKNVIVTPRRSGWSLTDWDIYYRSVGHSWVKIGKLSSYGSYTIDGLMQKSGSAYGMLALIPSWEATYKATYDANGGIGAPSGITYKSGTTYTLSTTVPIRTGYTFNGWALNSVNGTVYQPGATIGSDITIGNNVWYAKWTVNSVSLTLDSNGGSIPATAGWGGTDTLIISTKSSFTAYGTLPEPSRTGYRFLGWRKNLLNIYEYADFINSKTDRTNMNYVTFSDKGVLNMTPEQNYHLVNGEQQSYLYQVNLPVAGQYRLSYYAYNTRSDSNPSGAFRISTNGSTIKVLNDGSIPQIASQTRTKYETLYEITTAGNVGVYLSWNYAGLCYLDNIVLELVSPTSSSWPASAFATSTTTRTASETLTAQWEISTYTYTINYYGGTTRQTNTTNLSVTASTCSPSTATTIASGSFAKFTHAYTTTAQTITFKLPSAESYSYYMKIGSAPTDTSYTKLYTTSSDSYSINWTPTWDSTINVYVYQRYRISYASNGGSGTLPSTQYKIHGTSITLGSNNLTKTSYTAYGWNTNSAGTSTAYTSGATYSADSNATLYADWTPIIFGSLKIYPMVSSDGENWSISSVGGDINFEYYYDKSNQASHNNFVINSIDNVDFSNKVLRNYENGISTVAKEGYVCLGTTTNSKFPPYFNISSYKVTEDGNYYVYFMKKSSNNMIYNQADDCYYFEDGEYPQSYVGATLNAQLTNDVGIESVVGYLIYNNGKSEEKVSIVNYNGTKYAMIKATKTQTIVFDRLKFSSYSDIGNAASVTFLQNGYIDLTFSQGSYSDNAYSNSKVQKLTANGYGGELWNNVFTKTEDMTMIKIGINGSKEDACVYFDVTEKMENGKQYRVSFVDNNSYPCTSGKLTNIVIEEVGEFEKDMYYFFEFEPIKWRSDANENFEGGEGKFIALDKSLKYEKKFTVNIWAYMNNWADYGNDTMRIISCTEDGGWNLESSEGKIIFAIYDYGNGYRHASSDSKWADLGSGWHMFTLIFDGSYAKLYIDSVYHASTGKFTGGKVKYNSTNTIFIGAEAESSATTPVGYYFDGIIRKDILILDYALDESVLDYLYHERNTNWKNGERRTSFDAVSDTILWAGAVTSDLGSVSEGWEFTDSDMYSAVSSGAKFSESKLMTISNATNTKFKIDSGNYVYDYFGETGQQEKVKHKEKEESYIRVASIEEIENCSINSRAKASDMVCFMLGINGDTYCDYWTRDLGGNLKNGKMITSYGMEKTVWLNRCGGIRFSITFAEGCR